MMCGHDDPARCNHAMTLAITAAVIQYRGALPAACSRIRARLKQLDVQGYRTQNLIRLANEIVAHGYISTTEGVQQHDAVRVADALNDREIPGDLIVPPGWIVDENGIGRVGSNPQERVASVR